MALIVWASVALLGASGCASIKPVTMRPATPVLIASAMGCYGSCPNADVVFLANGTVVYVRAYPLGRTRTAPAVLHLAPRRVARLVDEIRADGFADLEERYFFAIDAYEVGLSVGPPERRKVVTAQIGRPFGREAPPTFVRSFERAWRVAVDAGWTVPTHPENVPRDTVIWIQRDRTNHVILFGDGTVVRLTNHFRSYRGHAHLGRMATGDVEALARDFPSGATSRGTELCIPRTETHVLLQHRGRLRELEYSACTHLPPDHVRAYIDRIDRLTSPR